MYYQVPNKYYFHHKNDKVSAWTELLLKQYYFEASHNIPIWIAGVKLSTRSALLSADSQMTA
jgi:hypothetical protein